MENITEHQFLQEIDKYPNGFYGFNNGNDISNEEIINWIKKCFLNAKTEMLAKDISGSFNNMASGNTEVGILIKKAENNKFDIEISVSKNRLIHNFFDVDLEK